MRCSLALLLALGLSGFSALSCDCAGGVGTGQEARLRENVGEVAVQGAATTGCEDCVGMIDICSGKVLNRRLESGESDDDLWKVFRD